MIKAVITGNIASGKSEVEKIIVSLGYRVVDSDNINNQLLTTDIETINAIKMLFGTDILNENGTISKPKLAKIVFNSKEKRKQLESILHPRIKDRINKFFYENSNKKIAFASVPLLFETKWDSEFDKIIFISANEEIRLKRLMARNNLTKEDARKRIEAQDSEMEKIRKSDFVINNNGGKEELKTSVIKVINEIKYRYFYT